ncbi:MULTISPECIES: hypothetical protein [Neptunicella]|uniref:Uncharacterized protein n=1 Tax=Neptunicella marina TaxID=2125989 RepID=A0A8J6IXZ7_9ALTE|nr:hypothetical protein [Neptunicella marina]MBC3767462.1 hypothetical protein [Neptunicella marina]
MKTLKFFYDNPITWVVFLALLQVSVAFYVQPSAEKLLNEQALYEKVLSDTQGNTELVELFKSQQSLIDSKNEMIVASLDFQKAVGGISALILVVYLFVLFRRSRK